MRVIVGAPVANRAWALPTWFQALAAQTVRPDGFVFVHGGKRYDATWRALDAGAREVGADAHISHDGERFHLRHDRERFRTLVRCRNTMLALARLVEAADVFVSLDTDVILDDPRSLERLVGLLLEGWDTASPITWLHPAGEGSWAFNAGYWPGPEVGDPQRPWFRADREDAESGEVLRIDVPMAAIAMNRRVLRDCRYRWHESGEDLGFAHDLDRIRARCAWDTGLKARHLWDETHLEAP